MTDINQIITEWTYRLDSGYPTKDSDYDVLQDILQELTELEQPAIQRIVRNAKGLEEADPGEVEPESVTTTFTGHETEFELDEDMFFQILRERYINEMQDVQNIPALYKYITTKLPESDQIEIKEILLSKTPNPGFPLENGREQITGVAKTLYDAIANSGIKVTNGHFSELWFAIIFKGQVAGAIGGKEDIETDVELDRGDTISLKAYSDAYFDLGSLPPTAVNFLKKFEAMAELVTGEAPEYSSMTATDINRALVNLNKESIQSDLKQFLELNSDVNMIVSLQQQIKSALYTTVPNGDPEKLEDVTRHFCLNIDEFIKSKLSTVNWWAFIVGGSILYLRDVASVYDALKSQEYPPGSGKLILGNGISNFKGGKLFVGGGPLDIFKKYREKE